MMFYLERSRFGVLDSSGMTFFFVAEVTFFKVFCDFILRLIET